MADRDRDQPAAREAAPAPAAPVVHMLDASSLIEQQTRRTQAELAKGPQNQTVPGGRYEVNGVLCNANGEPLKDQDRE
jgi:hypothetical protein